MAWGKPDCRAMTSGQDCCRAGSVAGERGLGSHPIAPRDIRRDATASAQAGDPVFRPGARQGWKQADGIIVALRQHLGNGGGAAEIGVDLEGRMGVEHVRQGAFAKQPAQHQMPAPDRACEAGGYSDVAAVVPAS
jgi:hypothetical protein